MKFSNLFMFAQKYTNFFLFWASGIKKWIYIISWKWEKLFMIFINICMLKVSYDNKIYWILDDVLATIVIFQTSMWWMNSELLLIALHVSKVINSWINYTKVIWKLLGFSARIIKSCIPLPVKFETQVNSTEQPSK